VWTVWGRGLTSRLISLVGVKWSCLRMTERGFPLQGFGIAARYHTITWGANDEYKTIDYYKARPPLAVTVLFVSVTVLFML